MDLFWLDDPNVLFRVLEFIPTADMSMNRKLNAATRLVLLSSLGLWLSGRKEYLTVLVLGGALILFCYYYYSRGNIATIESFGPKRGEIVSCNGMCELSPLARINAKYEGVSPIDFNSDDSSKRSYMNAKYEVTPLFVPSPFNELWRNEPEYNGEFTMIPDAYEITDQQAIDNLPKSQCHYITRNVVDLLPSQNGMTDFRSAKEAADSNWMKSSTEFRESIMGEHMDRFQRERQHNCTDIKVGRKTY